MMKIKNVILHHISLKLKEPFRASNGIVYDRESILVEVIDHDGMSGWGEVVAFTSPWYTEETIQTCFHMLKDFIIPLLLNKTVSHPNELPSIFQLIKRNNMAKASIEGAVWDLYAKKNRMSLSKTLGGTRAEIDCGVVIGIGPLQQMIDQIHKYNEDGYKRFKVKISPSNAVKILEGIRTIFPHIPLMADANSSYSLKDIKLLKELDNYNLLMIEQPLASDDIIHHAKAQDILKTPICLDESIVTSEDVRHAIELGSCKVINIKAGRVGGLTEAKKIHDICMEHQIPVWCGGMIETGISRAHNIALASLGNFTIPGDISSSSKYWYEDVLMQQIKVEHGKIKVPDGIGMGYEVNREIIKKLLVSISSF
ncbi:o-succinylbenzoate synthase [Metabacillus fastidiosus]|uniref:o-succinylbenzoate synthase n=1 Tax=Metabacillus fastidiosus TaxID=1458 RepID=A0ABU6NWN4_9BACI|nr:o-succinylbenzoate synthase [Metabacillus fastidiosus]MED4401305.1 o-succinylbenzoate synthase [Metabacillus fastidiosus]MED4464232.1 o-succinylbenzoate synthase [Metabacillus fastidiosus]